MAGPARPLGDVTREVEHALGRGAVRAGTGELDAATRRAGPALETERRAPAHQAAVPPRKPARASAGRGPNPFGGGGKAAPNAATKRLGLRRLDVGDRQTRLTFGRTTGMTAVEAPQRDFRHVEAEGRHANARETLGDVRAVPFGGTPFELAALETDDVEARDALAFLVELLRAGATPGGTAAGAAPLDLPGAAAARAQRLHTARAALGRPALLKRQACHRQSAQAQTPQRQPHGHHRA